MAKFIAFYLPQYHPTKENDEWWGPGFTDWRSVNMAKPLFKGHVQPKVPRELGYYDLRLEDSRIKQGDLAQKYGVDAFCYWHYWFGDGLRLLNQPFDAVVKSGKPDIPFCLGWANHSWYKKAWGGQGKDFLLCEQKYLGEKDDILHFETMLPAFQDKRYFRNNGKMVFIIYQPLANEHIKDFITTWRELAKKHNLGDFYFIGKDSYSKNKKKILDLGFDAIYNDNIFGILHRESKLKKTYRFIMQKLFNRPMIFQYKDAIKFMLTSEEKDENVVPTIVPNWDHSPRSGTKNPIFINSKPKYFQQLVSKSCNLVKDKHNDLVIIKSWNEWGEGNYLEPDMEYGLGMLEALVNGKK
jgi:lipopolysaccharide biosynthesis protein